MVVMVVVVVSITILEFLSLYESHETVVAYTGVLLLLKLLTAEASFLHQPG